METDESVVQRDPLPAAEPVLQSPNVTQGENPLVVFLDHKGSRFLFPFENCRTWGDFKTLVAQAYASAPETTRNDIEREHFDILTSEDDHVLSAAWEAVIKALPLHKQGEATYTIKLAFRMNRFLEPSRRTPDRSFYYERPRVERIPLSERGNERDHRSRSPSPIRPSDRENKNDEEDDDWYQHPPAPVRRDTWNRSPIQVRMRTSAENLRRDNRTPDPPKDDFEFVGTRQERIQRERGGERSRVSFPPSIDDETDDYENSNEDSDGESSTSPDGKAEDPEPLTIIPPPRKVIPPVDHDGNPLSFMVDTDRIHRNKPNNTQIAVTQSGNVNNPRDGRSMKSETLKILKAVSVTDDRRTMIQLHTFPGPENEATKANVNVRWYHLQGNELDFAKFKDVCLTIQDLPERLRLVTLKTLERVEKEKLKAFLGGMFIEPGTVLRGDEEHQTDPFSVIFSCIPHFDIQPPFKPSVGTSDYLHPPRSLMQSYYPYEPVRERDMEQAFKKFANGSSGNIIQVPSLWMMNIGTHAVVTCGHRTLSSDFVKSITVVPEDIKSPGVQESGDSMLLNMRLTDWEGRVFLYSPAECRSYFEMEQKLRVLKFFSRSGSANASLQLAWVTKEGKKKVTPGNWLSILSSRALIFIDLSALDVGEAKEMDEGLKLEKGGQVIEKTTSPNAIPPFFRWPLPSKLDLKSEGDTFRGSSKEGTGVRFAEKGSKTDTIDNTSPEYRRATHCLEQVEKAMLTETINTWDAENVVDKTFTTTKYYQSLPEESFEAAQTSFATLRQDATSSAGLSSSNSTRHQVVINIQCSQLAKSTSDLIQTVNATLKLFVLGVDKNTMLRKVWGAMRNIATITAQVQHRCSSEKYDAKEYTDPEWKASKTGNRRWFIRKPVKPGQEGFTSFPDDNPDLTQAIKKCKRCRHNKVYTNPQAALDHLENHLQSGTTATPDLKSDLRKWLVNDAQSLVERTNTGYLAIVTKASEAAQSLLVEAQQLAQGVQNDEGKMSDFYTFPQELLQTLQRLIVFYLAIERAFHYTKLGFDRGYEWLGEEETPFSDKGLQVLARFYEGAKASFLVARKELCLMTRTSTPDDFLKRLSLSPEYLCSWFMRRLLVKPLKDSMTVADIYREYLSNLQFQVNHRPGKRLLRSINLLQEELGALTQVNTWQSKLIDSYMRVLDDSSYAIDIPSRRSFFQYERALLDSCQDNLDDALDDYHELIRRCGPLSESTKQSAEINEEDHGKAIFVFTVVTVIFMPLSFVTSYLGMNTSDIRDMENKQGLFWSIAIPLTAVTMGSILFMAYNGDELRDTLSSGFNRLIGKHDANSTARSISVAQRKRAQKSLSDSSSTVDYKSLADEAEFAPPRVPMQFGFQRYKERSGYVDSVAPVPTLYDHYTAFTEPRTTRVEGDYYSERPNRTSTFTTQYPARKLRAPPLSTPPPPLPPAPVLLNERKTRPTYMRVSSKYVDPETLLYYGIPYKIDNTSPDFFQIMRYMDDIEMNVIYEHSKRLRDMREGNKGGKTNLYSNAGHYGGMEEDEYYGEIEKGYDWVRKRDRKPEPWGRRRGERYYDDPTEERRDDRGTRRKVTIQELY